MRSSTLRGRKVACEQRRNRLGTFQPVRLPSKNAVFEHCARDFSIGECWLDPNVIS
jgi:hypothetical protein